MTTVRPSPPTLSSPHGPPSPSQSPSTTHHPAPILCPKPHRHSQSNSNRSNHTPSSQAIVHHFQTIHQPSPTSTTTAHANTNTITPPSVPDAIVSASLSASPSAARPVSSTQTHSRAVAAAAPYQANHPPTLPPPPPTQPQIPTSQCRPHHRRSHHHNQFHHQHDQQNQQNHHSFPTTHSTSVQHSSKTGLPHLSPHYHYTYASISPSTSTHLPSSIHPHIPLHPLPLPSATTPAAPQHSVLQQDLPSNQESVQKYAQHQSTPTPLSLPIPTYSSGLLASQPLVSHRSPQPRDSTAQPNFNKSLPETYGHHTRQAHSFQHAHVSSSFSHALPNPSPSHASEQSHPTSQQPSVYLSNQHISNPPSYPGLTASLNLCNPALSSPTTPLTHGMATHHLNHPSLSLSTDHPPQPSIHNSNVSLSHSHNQPLAFTHNQRLSCTNPPHSSLLLNAVPSHQALNNSHNLPPQPSPTPCMSFQMQSHPQSLHQSIHQSLQQHPSSFTSGSAQLTSAQSHHTNAIPPQNPDLHENNVQTHTAHQSKTALQAASQSVSACNLNSSLHGVAQENLVAPSNSHNHGISHPHIRGPDDVEDPDDMMNFDSIHHTARNQEMPSTLGHSTAFASEPLPHGVTDGAPDIDALLPEADSLNVPLQMPLGMDTSARTMDRSLLGGGPENDSGVRNDTMAPTSAPYISPDGMITSSHGNPNAFSMHVSQSVGFGYTPHGVSENILLQGGPSPTFSVSAEKESPLGDGTVATEAVAPMLMLRRATMRDTDGVPAVDVPTRDEGHDIHVESENPQGTNHMPQSDSMRQDGMPTLSDGEGEVEGVTSHGAANSAFGCNQISIQDLTKSRPECIDGSTSQNVHFSPSSPAYSAVTVTSPAILQPPHSVTAAAAAAAAAAGVPRNGLNASGTSLSLPGGNANAPEDAGKVGGSEFNAAGNMRCDSVMNDEEVANGVATVTQSNIGPGNGVQSPTSVTAPSGLICPLCKTQFTRRYNLKVHMTSKHSARRDYHCKQCPNAFNRGDSLKRHIATTHRGEKKWRCPYCQRDFGQRPHMKMHIDTVHLKKRDHKCHCGKAFGTRYNLTAHQRTHQQTPKKHVCGVCNKSFALKSSLARHQRNSGHGAVVDGADDKTVG